MIINQIPIKSIQLLDNIRQKSSEQNITEIMASIRDNGLLQPIGVKENKDNSYTLIWGFRRMTACRKLGHKTISAVIFSRKDESMTEEQFFIINAIENLHQKPNSLYELGRIVSILRRNMSESEIAVRLSIPKSRVQSALTEIKRIPKTWHKRIKIMNGTQDKAGDIPLTSAVKIARLRGLKDKQKEELYDLVSKDDKTIQEIDLIGALMKKGVSKKEALILTKDYRTFNLKAFINKDKLDVLLKKNNCSMLDLVVNTVNSVYPNLMIKDITQKGYHSI